MIVSYRFLSLAFFWLCQPLIYYIFIEYGRDTPIYLEMAKGIGVSYLEPFWQVIFYFLGVLKGSYWINFIFMYSMLLFGSYAFLTKAMGYCRGGFGYLVTSFLLISIQLAVVGGAFRQGIVIFIFSYFLLSANRVAWLVSIIAHWSGIVYSIFYARAKYFFPLLVAGLFVGSTLLVLVGEELSTIRRLIFYLSDPFETSPNAMYGVVITKIVVFILFCFNARLLPYFSLAKSWSVMHAVYVFSPVIQVIPFLLTGSQQVLHRFGMIFDPFVIVFFVLIASHAGVFSRLIVLSLVLVKLASRVVTVLNV
ncbi:hypothetical protein [Teredinibacter turnerae]|uniref:hypothetical protein n=1 Tax=Teredinibacter turnerae TaxID=2426 RepID=UPI000370E0D5|nr:hypothetical protein [Teredinibacter turnerae]